MGADHQGEDLDPTKDKILRKRSPCTQDKPTSDTVPHLLQASSSPARLNGS